MLEFVIMTFLEMAIVNIFKGRYSELRLYETPSKAFVICIISVCFFYNEQVFIIIISFNNQQR